MLISLSNLAAMGKIQKTKNNKLRRHLWKWSMDDKKMNSVFITNFLYLRSFNISFYFQ